MPDLAYFYPQGHAEHAESNHPERPERVESIRQALVEAGWWDPYPKLAPERLSEQVFHSIHAPAYLHRLENACQDGRRLDMDTFTTPQSWQLALNAAGGAVAVARAVWRREAWRGFALCRPPGHHATADQGMGFCLLNNVALAAETLLQIEGALSLAIIDLDLHHGNGTQDIFYDRADVLTVSIHGHPRFAYPYFSGFEDETGTGPGLGYNVNFPLPEQLDGARYRETLGKALKRIGEFHPAFLVLALGLDPAKGDPTGSWSLLAKDFFLNGKMIGALKLPVLIVQEGGYKTRSLGLNARQFFAGLLETEPGVRESEKAPGKEPIAQAESGIAKKSEKDQGKKNHGK